MWWVVVFAVLLLPFIYLLFAPFFIEIDSTIGLYRFRFHHLASASVTIKENSLYLLLNIAWWDKEYDLLEKGKATKSIKATEKKPVEKRANHLNNRKLLKRIWKVAQSFKVNKCYIIFDTGDMPLNGILYPWFFLLSWKTGKTISVNFWDENEIVLEVENSMARIIWAFITA